MPKTKTVEIHTKPKVDLDKLDRLAEEEEEKLDKTVKEIEDGDEGDEEEDEAKKKAEEEAKKKAEEEKQIDYEKKFKESQKEAMVLKAQLDRQEAEKNKKVEVNDDFLKAKYPDWEEMTTGEQRAIKKSEELEQEVKEIKNAANKFNNDREWQRKVVLFVSDELPDLFPKIVGREEEFTRFATRPTRKGLPLDDLSKLFLYENPAPEKKRTLFHDTSAGGDVPVVENGMSAEDIKALRVSRPTEYMRLIRQGKIKIKI